MAVLFGCACGQKAAAPAVAPAEPAQPEAVLQPLKFEFKEPATFKSADGANTVPPPDLNAETWRVMVNQNEPMQRKNPFWQPLPARETVELQMTAGWKYRCMVAPLQVKPQPNEWGTELSAWMYTRTLMCSNDDFKSWSEAVLNVRQSAKGKRKAGPDAGLLLRERGDDGQIKQMFVMMRSDKENTLPTYGPPQIVAGRKVADDDDE
jgi:hypothetical protein